MGNEFFPVLVPHWSAAIAQVALQPNQIVIWRANLNQPELILEALAATLSVDERERVARLRFAQHRHRAIASRGILRCLLGQYLNQPPHQVQFCYEAHGKPGLQRQDDLPPLTFNVSHSEDVGLFAIATDRWVGVDVEAQKTVAMVQQLMQRYFAPVEQAAIAQYSPDGQEHSFFYYWTCKEALTKATGRGIADLPNVQLQINPTSIQVSYQQTLTQERWHVQLLTPLSGYIAAIAYAAPEPRSLRFFDWQPDQAY